MTTRSLLFLGGIVLSLGVPMSAATIGSFNSSGTITVNDNTTITWNSDQSPFLASMFTETASTGIFAGHDGQNAIFTLTDATEPVGVVFAPQLFFGIGTGASEIFMDINFIAQGIPPTAGGATACTTGSFATASIGQTCAIVGSPFGFTNVASTGGSCCGSTAGFVFSGIFCTISTAPGVACPTADQVANETWTGTFTSQFSVPFQTVLAQLTATGSVTNAYSDTEIAAFNAPPPTPEPGPVTMVALGIGLLLISRSFRKLRRS